MEDEEVEQPERASATSTSVAAPKPALVPPGVVLARLSTKPKRRRTQRSDEGGGDQEICRDQRVAGQPNRLARTTRRRTPGRPTRVVTRRKRQARIRVRLNFPWELLRMTKTKSGNVSNTIVQSVAPTALPVSARHVIHAAGTMIAATSEQPLLQGRHIDPSECDEQRRESLMQITIRIHLACRYEDLIAHQHTDVSGKRLESASAQ